MTDIEIATVLDALVENDKRWSAMLPVTFMGQPLRLAVEYIDGPLENFLPLTRRVLGELEDLLPLAEAEFKAYHEELDPEALTHPVSPKVWIDEDAIIEDGPNRWAITVECGGRVGYGTHLEFDGGELLEIWSGD